MPIALAVLFTSACILSGLLTVVVYKVAPRFGFTDNPDEHRKNHKRPVALGGGVAIFVTAAVILGLALIVPGPLRSELWENWPNLVALLLASVVILIVGLVDDRVGLRGRQKLVGQILAAIILMIGGLLIQRVDVFGWQISMGLLAIPFTLFWLLGAVNALNLLDGIDGLAAMLGFILVSAIAIMAMMIGRAQVPVIALVFAGSLLGFLPFNLPPARVFLGDAGSMLIGLVVGALAIEGSLKGPGTVLLAAPLAIWTIPILDSAAAILRRKLTGRSIYATDHGHLHHRLLARVGSNRKVLVWVAVSCALTSTAALTALFLKNDLIAFLTCAAIVTIFTTTGVFGRVEFSLAARHLRKTWLSLLPRSLSKLAETSETTLRLQGSREWELLWDTLTEAADKLCLSRICLNVNLPAAQEQYHATWEQRPENGFERCWIVDIPLGVSEEPVGRLTIFGRRNGESACWEIGQLLELLEPFEEQFLHLSEHRALPPVAEREHTAVQG